MNRLSSIDLALDPVYLLLKDLILLGACLATCAEALRAARARHRAVPPASEVPAARVA